MARENLAVLEATVAEVAAPLLVPTGDEPTAIPNKGDATPAKPSLFGLQEPPTHAQLIEFERRTLAVLDGLIARIELMLRYPDLPLFEYLLRNPVPDPLFRKAWIDARMRNGVPDGVVQRCDGIDFDLLDGPYLFDTEPSYTQREFAAWRGSIWALSYLPEQIAIPALQRVAAKCFATSLMPNHAGWNYAPQGYRAEELGKAVIWALEKLPEKAGLPALSDLLARMYPEPLRESLREAIKRVESGKVHELPAGFYPDPMSGGR